MVDLDTAQIHWDLAGKTLAGSLKLRFTSTFTMNVLTGRVESHSESWSPADGATQSAALLAFTLKRISWSAAEQVKDVVEGVKEAMASLGDDDDADPQTSYFIDPMDPNKYIQEQDTTMQDALQIATFIAFLYAIVSILNVIFVN